VICNEEKKTFYDILFYKQFFCTSETLKAGFPYFPLITIIIMMMMMMMMMPVCQKQNGK